MDSVTQDACKDACAKDNGCGGYVFESRMIGWRELPDKNCYPGHGGDVLGNEPYHSSLSLDACKVACAADDECEGIVFEQKEEGPCY